MSEQGCSQGPTGLRFTIGGYEFRHYRKGECRTPRRWEASKNGRGVGWCWTPFDAWWRCRRWLREPTPFAPRET